jgi:hypothetical protein
MNDQLNDELSQSVIAELKDIYAPPSGEQYWSALAQRIVRSAASAPRENVFWGTLARWAGPGIAAALLVLAAAGAVWNRLERDDLIQTYDAFSQPMTADAVGAAQLLASNGSSSRDATLGYVISH